MSNSAYLFAVLLILAGCGGADGNSVQAQCDRQSYDDPVVHQLQMERLGDEEQNFNLKGPFEAARKQAIYRCLTARGAAPPGGVQPVMPTY